MSETRSKSNKALAMANASIVLQVRADDSESLVDVFEEIKGNIDKTGVLRFVGPESYTRTDRGYHELQYGVEYGPVFGCSEYDVRRQLKKIIETSNCEVLDSAVFHFSRRELTDGADIERMLDIVIERMEDTEVPLMQRKQLAKLVARFRTPLDVAAKSSPTARRR